VLHETQLILALLRSGDDDIAASPTRDIAQIPVLLETFRAAGVVVDAVINTDTGDLDPAVSPSRE
jgi:hypothetical protein